MTSFQERELTLTFINPIIFFPLRFALISIWPCQKDEKRVAHQRESEQSIHLFLSFKFGFDGNGNEHHQRATQHNTEKTEDDVRLKMTCPPTHNK